MIRPINKKKRIILRKINPKKNNAAPASIPNSIGLKIDLAIFLKFCLCYIDEDGQVEELL